LKNWKSRYEVDCFSLYFWAGGDMRTKRSSAATWARRNRTWWRATDRLLNSSDHTQLRANPKDYDAVTLGHSKNEFTAAKYLQDELHIEHTSLSKIADTVGTPAYVYSTSYLTDQYNQLSEALTSTPHQIHYSVKANSNLAILSLFKSLGAGFDIVFSSTLMWMRKLIRTLPLD
jgi:hypothetical protein